MGHLEEVELLIKERDLDILCISETWLLPVMQDRFINIPNFNVFRCDQGRGGGVCVYVRDTLKTSNINLEIPKNNVKVEDLWITVQCRHLPSIIVGTIYRHPHALSDSYDYILDVFRHILLRDKPVIILGDLNDNLFLPNARLGHIIKSLKMSQIINKPTHITATSASLLDIISTNTPDIIIHSEVLPSPIADHEHICAIVDISKPKRLPVYKTYRCLDNYEPNILCNLILEQTPVLNTTLSTDNVDIQIDTITTVMNNTIDSIAPMVTKLVRRPPAPWMNENLKTAIKERDHTRSNLKTDRLNVVLQEEYKSKKKSVKSNIHKAKTEYYQHQFKNCGKDTSKMWKVVKHLIPNNTNQSKAYHQGNITDKVEEFNDFFPMLGKKHIERHKDP